MRSKLGKEVPISTSLGKYARLARDQGVMTVLTMYDNPVAALVPLQIAESCFGGAEMIAMERMRQRNTEGWSADHDDGHDGEELALAAMCYACPPGRGMRRTEDASGSPPVQWPWNERWYKPCRQDRVKELVKAGALIAAEIDRLLREEGVGGEDP